MKKKLLGLSVIGLAIFGLASCGSESKGSSALASSEASSSATASSAASSSVVSSSAASSGVVSNLNYKVKVVDIDGEVLLEKDLVSTSKNSVLTDLQSATTVVGYEGTYGYSLSSIAGSVVDSNYYLAIYENDAYASTGIEGLTIDEGDTFTFQVECWNTVASGYGTLTDTDVLIDKTIYKYAKEVLPEKIAADTTYSGSNYWSYMTVSLMANNGYDTSVFNTASATDTLKNAVSSADVTALSGANFGKYYYTNRALGNDTSDDFKTSYTSYLEGLTGYASYGEYTNPFSVSPAYSLNLGDKVADAVKNPTYTPSTSYGYDGYCWYLTANALWKDTLSADDLAVLPTEVQANSVSQAALLLPYAAYNQSGAAIAKLLMDNYYDSTTGFVKYTAASDKGTNYMIEQVYAGLAAYKVQRDKAASANLFA